MKEKNRIGENRGNQVRNPYGVMDVPDPNDRAVAEFAISATLDGSEDDANAMAWCNSNQATENDTIDGEWRSRWNGGPDPTIPGDTRERWKEGKGELKQAGGRVYVLFDWDNGARKGLIDARREGAGRLVGKYINLTAPEIMRPWVGVVVNNQRIDGLYTGGRLDFRR